MGQPSDPGRRWTIFVCPECDLIAPPFMAQNGGYECCTDHEPVACEYVEVVPAGGLVAELEAERARADRAEAALESEVAYVKGLRTAGKEIVATAEGLIADRDRLKGIVADVTRDHARQVARAEQAEKDRDKAEKFAREAADNWIRPALEDFAERSAVPTATVTALRALVAWIDGFWEDDLGHRSVMFTDTTPELLQARAALAEHPRPGDGE